MVTLYRLLGVVVLLALLWVNARGWAPGTRHDDCTPKASAGDPAVSSATRDCPDRQLRARSYRGGK
jgi:hypothetical protein